MKCKSKAAILQKVKKMINVTLLLVFMMGLFGLFSIDVQAKEIVDDYLPEGWTRIETNILTSEEISAISAAIYGVDETIQPKAPAPPLTSLEIIDLAVDENNEIHVVTREIGTSTEKMRFVYWNNSLCPENIYEVQHLVGADHIIYGSIHYFHTGVYYSESVSGMVVRVTAKSTNASNPWNILNASRTFELP